MERLIKLGSKFLRMSGIEIQEPTTREERIESIATFIQKANPQKSIRVVTGGEELDEVIEGISRGLSRIKGEPEIEIVTGGNRGNNGESKGT